MVWSHIPEVDGGDATTPGRKIGVAVSPAAIVVVLKWKIQIQKEPDQIKLRDSCSLHLDSSLCKSCMI